MMDEKTALTKWCPFDSNNIGTTIHYESIPNASYCIGSECAVWRWNRLPSKQHQMSPVEWPDEYSETDGYCGLAK